MGTPEHEIASLSVDCRVAVVLDKFVRNGFHHINMPSILLFCFEYVNIRDTCASMRETTP